VTNAVTGVTQRTINFYRPSLYEKQRDAMYDEHRIVILEASTKSGKTSGGIAWLIERAFMGRSGHNFWWVAPVSGQADIAFRRAARAMDRTLFTTNIALKTITLVGGQVIWFKSADHPDSLYGEDVYAAVIDEASRMKEDAWYAVRTTLTATRGPVRIIGNVQGRRNWFYALARRAQSGDAEMGYHKLIAADAIAAGVLDEAEVASAKSVLPDNVFRELYLAEASDDQGNPFGIDAIRRCVAPLSRKLPVAWGWDLGKKVDWTVGVALDEDGRTCRFERFQIPWPETLAKIKLATGRVSALVDSTGLGDPILDQLQRIQNTKFEGFLFTAPSKQRIMEGLAVAIQSNDISYPDGLIVTELEAFEFQMARTYVRYSAPEGMHDDCVCALALAREKLRTASADLSYDESLDWVAGKKRA
jgi:hypothetical protein